MPKSRFIFHAGCLWMILCVAFAASPAKAFEIVEPFAVESSSWHVVGNASLFSWKPQQQNLEVTWDSTQPNSYWYLPLGMTLNRNDDFSVHFTLLLSDLMLGINPEKTGTFEIAAGLINTTNALDPGMYRGSGISPRHGPKNLIEFDYFPDSNDFPLGATVAPTIVSQDNRLVFSDNHPLEMTTEDTFEINLSFAAAAQTLTTKIFKNGEPFGNDGTGELQTLILGSSFSDFKVNAFAVCSYSDAGQPPQGDGSLLAHGIIDDIRIILPDPPACHLSLVWSDGQAALSFNTDSQWLYTPESSNDLKTWTQLGATLLGTGGDLRISDPDAHGPSRFYRVQMERP